MKKLILIVLLLPSICFGLTNTAISLSTVDVNNAINGGGGFTALSDGDTCVIPSGTATWTTGVSVTKAIKIQGAGSGRIVAYSASEQHDVATGTLTLTIAGYSPGFSSSVFSGTMRVFMNNNRNNWMQGTVTSFSAGVLTMNITSINQATTTTVAAGSNGVDVSTLTGSSGSALNVASLSGFGVYGMLNVATSNGVKHISYFGISGSSFNKANSNGATGLLSTGGAVNLSETRWLVATVPSAMLVANNIASPFFNITESANGHVDLSGIQFSGTQNSEYLHINWLSNGKAVLIHDCWFIINNCLFDSIRFLSRRGVVWNCSFDATSGNTSALITNGQINISDQNNNIAGVSWSTPSTWGTLDTTGENALYIETNDFHTMWATSDNDAGGRIVYRYNLQDHAAIGSHGADTGPYGMRTYEIYNNTGVYYGYSNGTTFALPNGWFGLVRGGTFLVHDNSWPAMNVGNDYHNGDINMTVMMLNRNTNSSNTCWGLRFVHDGATTSGSPTVTSVTANLTSPDVGAPVAGAGIPVNSYIGIVNSSTSFGLSSSSSSNLPVNATATAANVFITIGSQPSAGAFYPFPRQVGMGYVTGTGVDGKGSSIDAGIYVGDSEPAYIWNNGRTISLGESDAYRGAPPGGCGLTADISSNYIVSGRDYFNGTAKPSYTPYTYPHPFTVSGAPTPVAPTFITVSPISPVIDVGSLLTITLTADGYPVPTFSMPTPGTAGVPSWETLSGNQITGTPASTTGSPFTFTVTATNASGSTTKSVTITVTNPNTYAISLGAMTLGTGSVFAGKSGTGTILVTNAGNSVLTINSVTISGQGGLPTYVTASGSTTVGVGASASWTFTYTPLAAGTLNSTIAFNCANSPTGTNTFQLTGTCPGRPRLRNKHHPD